MSVVGRSDLVRAFAEGGEKGMAAMARLLDYEDNRRGQAAEKEETGAAPSLERVARPALDKGTSLAPIPFWYLAEIEYFEAQEERPPTPTAAQPIGAATYGHRPGEPPPHRPLASESRLMPALRRRLTSEVPSREVDIEALAERWSQGRIVGEIPFRPLAAWSPSIVVLVDRSRRLIPFWKDQDRLVRRLRRRLGETAIREIRYFENCGFPWRAGRHRYRWPLIESGVPVLLLGDLGFLGRSSDRAMWRSVGEWLQRTGQPRVALLTCPANRWDPRGVRCWDAVEWERPLGAPRLGDGPGETLRRSRAERLLALPAFASRIEPGLLRAMRRLLPADEADAGTEADAWSHPELAGDFSPAGDLRAKLRRRLQARFAAETEIVKRGAVAALRSFRAALPEEIWLDEVLGLDAAGDLPDGILKPEEIEAARAMWRRVARTVGEESASAGATLPIKGFVRRSLGDRQPRELLSDPRLQPILWRAWEASHDGEPPLWAGVGPEVLGGERGPVRRFEAWQIGGELRLVLGSEHPGAGSPIVLFESSLKEIALHGEDERFATAYPLAKTTVIPLPESSSLVLRTDRSHAVLRRVARPQWASSMGRDRFGLWASFEVDGIVQRMRYIPPGRFFMGSPEDEPGRWGDEGPRHLETISEGFWLAETPCTQALWETVTGENPSEYPSADRPVEQVSWEDCRKFFETLEERVPGLAARFPSEAEWEYACRAGTETATYAGPIEILGAHNAPILDDIAWYGGNSGKDFDLAKGYDSSGWDEKQYEHTMAGTRPVAQRDPNTWGLYDMLGNVYEWCEDLWRPNYDAKPQGPPRVHRGGSWNADARSGRAACRFHGVPGFRWYSLGFRLARGQSAPGVEPQVAAVLPGAKRTRGGVRGGTTRRRRGSRPEAVRK